MIGGEVRYSKFIILAAIAVSAAIGIGAASAADLPARTYTKAPVMVGPGYNWTGFYIGVNGGGGWSANNNAYLSGTYTGTSGVFEPFGFTSGVAPLVNSIGLRSAGGLAGGQVGYNWQMANWVFGFEADADWANINGQTNFTGCAAACGFNVTQSYSAAKKLQGLETIRGRIGFLATPQFLLFATGGLALGQEQVSLQAVCPTCGPVLNAVNTSSTTQAGYTVGAGAEWKFIPQWSVKAEYLYVSLGNQSSTVTYIYGGGTSTGTVTAKQNYNIARVGVNYQFGGPVVARY
jgi:outer membrane immunogenic protein